MELTKLRLSGDVNLFSGSDLHECPVCGGGALLNTFDRHDGLGVYTCGSCFALHGSLAPQEREPKSFFGHQEKEERKESPGSGTCPGGVRLAALLDEFGSRQGLSVLEIGCGKGANLEEAAGRGWKCFGVETSEPARKAALESLAGTACVVEAVEDLLPHEFDLILLFDVIEHLTSPYQLFFQLFSLGAITPNTRIVITTPDAGALKFHGNCTIPTDGSSSSQIVYYSSEALACLLKRLHFQDLEIRSLPSSEGYGAVPLNRLMALASGSDFASFMRERYVPGTWSKVAEYEHLSRYTFARTVAEGKRILDFGCGTGYGSAILAQVAESVTGLDIDSSALTWARENHRNPRLDFHLCSDLGASLPAASFDLITCFEMIEHVDLGTQREVLASFGRLLADGGTLVISTPNPEVTRLYGNNPYHLREMTEEEFLELLHAQFPYVRILRQRACNSVVFDTAGQEASFKSEPIRPDGTGRVGEPFAYLALCSTRPLPELPGLALFDEETDIIFDFLQRERRLNHARAVVYRFEGEKKELSDQLRSAHDYVEALDSKLSAYRLHADDLNEQLGKMYDEYKRVETELVALRHTKIFRLRDAITQQPWSLRKLLRIVYLFGAIVVPSPLRVAAKPLTARLRNLCTAPKASPVAPEESAYVVCQRQPNLPERGRVVHVIANFMTGGSSRLVVDLLEYIGHRYEQSVITSFIPTPPAYTGLDIHEIRFPENEEPFLDLLRQMRPAFVHVHYWGDTDEPWYAKAISAAQRLGVPVVENVNTPVAPFVSPAVRRYVYVSDYVRRVFGRDAAHHLTIHPGSDFSHFDSPPDRRTPADCVGMVYRLERDKLNEEAILPFIRTVQKRPQTRVLIVGGGSLLEPFRQAVREAGVADNFEFTGYVSYEELPSLYGKMSVFVAPVWKESFGQVSPFAMNMKIPVAGYDVGGIGEIVDDPTLLAPPADAERLSDIVVGLLESADLRESIGARQQERAQSLFSVQTMIDRYADLYEEMCREAVQR